MRRNFFRRRRTVSEIPDIDTVPSIQASAQGYNSEPLEGVSSVRENASSYSEQGIHYSSVHSAYNSTTSSKEVRDRVAACRATRAMTQKWYGIAEAEDEEVESAVPRVVSPFCRDWVEQHPSTEQQQQMISPRHLDDRERSPALDTFAETISVGSTHYTYWRNFTFLIVFIGVCVLFVPWKVLICMQYPSFRVCDGMNSCTKLSGSLPFRGQYFHALLYDDKTGRFGSHFERGLRDAASMLRVNISIEKSSDQMEMAKSIKDASHALFDGVIVTLVNELTVLQTIVKAQLNTKIITTGPLETHLKGFLLNTQVGYIGEEEARVGKIAAEKMKKAGMKTSLCLSHADNIASVHRCQGFKEAFGKKHTYELNLNTMMQSELKSKLIPTILDDQEINGLFVADPRSTQLVYQILKSLKRLCSEKKNVANNRCMYFGTYGTDPTVLKAIQKKEVQFTIDPQEYLHGYISVAWMMLSNNGYPMPHVDKKSTFSFSRILDTSEQATDFMNRKNRDPAITKSRFTVYHFGEISPQHLERLKFGLKNAARDLDVYVEFRHFIKCFGLEDPYWDCLNKQELDASEESVDGYAISSSVSSNSQFLFHFSQIKTSGPLSLSFFFNDGYLFASGKPFLTFGNYIPMYKTSDSILHIGLDKDKLPKNEPYRFEEHIDPALHGYLSILFLAINEWYGQTPFGVLSTK